MKKLNKIRKDFGFIPVSGKDRRGKKFHSYCGEQIHFSKLSMPYSLVFLQNYGPNISLILRL